MQVVNDVECYINYFLVGFKSLDRKKTVYFERMENEHGEVIIELDIDGLRAVMNKRETINFNGKNYDEIIISLALQGYSCAFLKEISDAIIVRNMRRWDIENEYNVSIQQFNSIDLIEVAKGQASLKLYAARIHSRKIQDLPIEPSALIDAKSRLDLRDYNGIDLDDTIDIFNFLSPQIKLREIMSTEYGVDLRSKSDAQIAEAVIKKELERLTKKRYKKPEFVSGRKFKYKAPAFIKFQSKELQDVLENIQKYDFEVGAGGKPIMPKQLRNADGDLYVNVFENIYKMGMGGLHSCEKSIAHIATEFVKLFDRDVASYYPRIILNERLYPKHLGPEFLKIIESIVIRRLDAKFRKDKVVAECLKIVVNGAFGKFGSMWSILYSPELLIQTTVTGQLSLLMLIERLNIAKIKVVSANTDGIVIKCDVSKRQKMLDIVAQWEKDGHYETEEVEYSALYSRDVNNYIAIKTNGEVKVKGAFAPAAIDKNPTNQISVDAAIDKIVHNIPISHTVRDCMDVKKFISVKRVVGGGHKDGEYLGKAVRWYHSTETKTAINYVKNNKQVGGSMGAMPIMQLPDSLPDDIDWNFYISQGYSILRDVGFHSPHPERPSKRRDKAIQAILDEVL